MFYAVNPVTREEASPMLTGICPKEASSMVAFMLIWPNANNYMPRGSYPNGNMHVDLAQC